MGEKDQTGLEVSTKSRRGAGAYFCFSVVGSPKFLEALLLDATSNYLGVSSIFHFVRLLKSQRL